MNRNSALPNLHKFALPPGPAASNESKPMTICGDILQAARSETERVAGERSIPDACPKLNWEAMLGVISYCYAKGVVSSREIEEHLWCNAAFLRAFGDDLPTAQSIRRFRRRHRDLILATIERALQQFSNRLSDLAPCTGKAAQQSPHIKAQQLLQEAIFTDDVELE